MSAQNISRAVGSAIRGVGKKLDAIGCKLEVSKYSEKLVVSTRSVPFKTETEDSPTHTHTHTLQSPAFPSSTFVAPTASLIGPLTVGPNSSIWYNAVVRADVNTLKIGSRTSIGDGCTVHVAKIAGDFGTMIGDDVTVGAGSVIHACTLGSRVMVGVGCQVLDGAVVGDDVILEAGCVITPGTKVGTGEVWGGSPGKMLRKATDYELREVRNVSERHVVLGTVHRIEHGKDFEQVLEDAEAKQDFDERDPEYFQPEEHNMNNKENIDRGVGE